MRGARAAGRRILRQAVDEERAVARRLDRQEDRVESDAHDDQERLPARGRMFPPRVDIVRLGTIRPKTDSATMTLR